MVNLKGFSGFRPEVQCPVRQLELSPDRHFQETLSRIAGAVKHREGITRIDLVKAKIGDDEAKALAKVLIYGGLVGEIHGELELALGLNQIGDPGAIALAEAIRLNRDVVGINLTANRIGDAGAVALAPALKINPTLKALVIPENTFTETGARALAEACKTNSHLIWLYVLNDRVGKKQIEELAAEFGCERLIDQQSYVNGKVFSEMASINPRFWGMADNFKPFPLPLFWLKY
jgi:hypothetical protein